MWGGKPMQIIDARINVTDAAGLGEPAWIATTVHLPAPGRLPEAPIVCFAKPGGGYSRGYFTIDLPGPGKGAQAAWHAERGWIFVSIDHLGVGDSSVHDAGRMTYTTVTAASQAAETEILARLAAGTLHPGYPPIATPLKIGIGQSMGGCLTIAQQGRYHCYDGIAVLGFSAIHIQPPTRPGTPPLVAAWLGRDTLLTEPLTILNAASIAAAPPLAGSLAEAFAWGFHYDDIPPEVVARDLAQFNRNLGEINFNEAETDTSAKAESAPWNSATVPGAVAQSSITPGIVAAEAAAVTSPVLVAMGERDVVCDPKGEPRAYLSASSIDLFICPRMAHMHNFAGTRELFWQRIEIWGDWVRATLGS
jgi:alpha-beta hydrolase superfamily lysophospholipase